LLLNILLDSVFGKIAYSCHIVPTCPESFIPLALKIRMSVEIQEKSCCRFVVITLNVKFNKKEGVQNIAHYADILNLAKSFHLLTYALLDKGINYDPAPLVWYRSNDESSQGIYSSSKDSYKSEMETEYRIGFLLSDLTKPQDGLLLHIEPETDSNIYVDLGIDE
jgi:hypothetical protein